MDQTSTPIKVRVHPKASRNQVEGFNDDVLVVKVAAVPEKGKANQALIELLAETLGIAKRKVKILRGQSSRDKQVTIDGYSLDQVRRRLGSR